MNLFKPDWIETVFEGRNKKYGAYVLRKQNARITLVALILGSFVFSAAISGPVIAKKLVKNKKVEDKTIDTKIIMAEILAPPPPPEEIEQPKVVKKTKTVQEVVKHTPPVIVEQEEVQEEMATVDDLKDKIAGSQNIEADPEGGELVIDGTEAEITNEIEVVDPNAIYTAVEVLPEYPGGEAEFRKFIQRNYEAPNIDRDIKGIVLLQFVVETDGSLTDIKILRDLGYGTGTEAVRVLKKAKKWNPGIQNGRNVRVRYNLPIQINVSAR